MEAAPARGLKKTGLLPILFWMKEMSMLTKSKPKDPTHMCASNKSVSMNLVRTAILCFALPLAIAMPQGCKNCDYARNGEPLLRVERVNAVLLDRHLDVAIRELNAEGVAITRADFDLQAWMPSQGQLTTPVDGLDCKAGTECWSYVWQLSSTCKPCIVMRTEISVDRAKEDLRNCARMADRWRAKQQARQLHGTNGRP